MQFYFWVLSFLVSKIAKYRIKISNLILLNSAQYEIENEGLISNLHLHFFGTEVNWIK